MRDPLSNAALAPDEHEHRHLLQCTAEIVSAFGGNSTISAADLPVLIQSVFLTLADISTALEGDAPPAPAVPIKKSVTAEHITCLECGKKMKMLKRHLRAEHDMTPEEYRERWNLSADYPMASRNAARRRSDIAKSNGFGTKGTRSKRSRKR